MAALNGSLANCHRDLGDVDAQRSRALEGARLLLP